MRLPPDSISCAATSLFLAASPLLAERSIQGPKKSWPSAIAVVVDDEIGRAASAAIDAYRSAVEEHGLSTYLIIDHWTRAEEVRAALVALANATPPIEGAFLVGDIPVPMLRGAQHLASADAIDEEQRPEISPVPSDVFYADFDLRFTFLESDSADSRFQHYALAADGAQRVHKEIYCGRLFQADAGPKRIEAIRAFLEKASRARKEPRPLARMLTLVGSGTEAEGPDAWEGSIQAQRESFPRLYRPGARAIDLNLALSRDAQGIALRELQDPALDIVILRLRAAPPRRNVAILPTDEPAPAVTREIGVLKASLRARMRAARASGGDVQVRALREELEEHLGVPSAWLDDAFDAGVARADAALLEARELGAQELTGLAPRAPVAILDAGASGAFARERSLASAWLIGGSATVAAIGSTVESGSSACPGEHLGLLALGVSVGQWHKRVPCFESELLGDPTFVFAGGNRSPSAVDPFTSANVGDEALDQMLEPESPPVLRAIALDIAERRGASMEATYARFLRSDPAQIVRLAALERLAALRSRAFETALLTSIADPSESVRRCSAVLMGEVGRTEYIAPLLKAFLRDPSRGVAFAASRALRRFDVPLLKVAVDEFVRAEGALATSIGAEERLGILVSSAELESAEELRATPDASLEPARRIAAIRVLRRSRVHRAVAPLLGVATKAGEDASVRIAAIEASSWFQYSGARGLLITELRAVAADAGAPELVRARASSAVNRLESGPNALLVP